MRRLAVVAIALLIAGAAAGADRVRSAAFERAISALEAVGDADGARTLAAIEALGPIMPPELAAGTTAAGNADAYERHRQRLALFRVAGRERADAERHLHRAEAALHLVAIELGQGPAARPALVARFLREAEWTLRLAGTPPVRSASPSPTIELTATPTVVIPGETSILRWNVTNAARVLLNDRTAPARGEETRRPDASEYHRLTAERDGVVADASVWIIVAPVPKMPPGSPPTASISLYPSRILAGESITLEWRTRHAETAALDGRPVRHSDSVILFPSASGRYRLTAESGSGRAQASAPVYVFARRAAQEATPTPTVEKPPDVAAAATPEDSVVVVLCRGVLPEAPWRHHLETAAAWLRADSASRLFVEGHADNTGREATNRRLALERAERVKRLLVRDHGCAAERITATGYGSERPRASNASDEGRRLNRRVEIRISQ